MYLSLIIMFKVTRRNRKNKNKPIKPIQFPDHSKFMERYTLDIFKNNGTHVHKPQTENQFLKVLRNPLHFKYIIFEQPQLHFALLLRYNTSLYLDHLITENDWIRRMTQTILLLSSSSSTVHHVWQYVGAIESTHLILLTISKKWKKVNYLNIMRNISRIIFASHIYHLFENPEFNEFYVHYLNQQYPNQIRVSENIIKSATSKLQLNELLILRRYFKLSSYNKIRCGNYNCNKNYLKDQYHFGVTIIDHDKLAKFAKKLLMKYLQQLYKEWINKCIYNKWKICKDCKRVKYCSRKCQKIAWNKQQHNKYCIYIEYIPK